MILAATRAAPMATGLLSLLIIAVGLTLPEARRATADVSPAPEQAVSVDTLVERAGAYVTRFIIAFSDVVAEERYVQDVSGTLPSGTLPMQRRRLGPHRELTSDLLLIRVGGVLEWRPFRDTFEVDGVPVRDRDERLARLFLRPYLLALERAEEIALESARYNIGSLLRTVNTPVHVLLFLQPSFQPRFRFELDKRDPAAGEGVWIVRYQERERPTLIRGDGDTDLAASGRYWIEENTGRVLKAELTTSSTGVTAFLTTSFSADDEFGIAVPTEMRETYQLQRARITALATYGRFRRFEVSTSTDVDRSVR